MNRFERRTSSFFYFAVAMVIGLIFVADLLTPRGIAVWIFYLMPIVASLYLWRPVNLLRITAIVSVLYIVGYFASPAAETREFVSQTVGISNRIFGLVTIWVVATICFYSIRNKIAVSRQQWLQSGQSLLAEKMAGDQRIDELGANILQFLAEHMSAQVGVLYVKDNEVFRRVSAYAVPADAGIPERIAVGDGLLGQVIQDKRALVVQDIPDGYLVFGSALGRHQPRNLILAPITVDRSVVSVLELGLVKAVDESDLELLRLCAQALGLAIRSAQYRTRLQELLEETQRQAEELQAQSEELRVSNEELEEQSRALKESQAELEHSNSQLEEQTQQLEMQKDTLSRSQASLTAQAQELEKVNRYKSEFLANMSHELRTPLNSSLILAKLLAENKNGNLTAEQVKYAQTIHGAGMDLLTLINDILDLSKVEAGRLDVAPAQVGMASLFQNLKSIFDPLAGQKKLQFQAQLMPGSPDSFRTDPQRLEQVLKNLISNAIKFTDQGEVVLQVSAPKPGRMAFAVRDTGIGIAEHQQQIIFEAFRQADGTTSRKYGGTGLGLSISRELARLLGGDISVTSVVGQGSTFTLTIPELAEGSPLPAKPAGSKALSGTSTAAKSDTGTQNSQELPPRKMNQNVARKEDDRSRLTGDSRVILVVEDDPAFVDILADLSHECQFQCLAAMSAEEGLALAAQYKPHAIVLDIGLPDFSGLSVLERLKHDVRTRHIPVHVVSANDYAQAALSLGAVGYMLKPVKRDELMHAFESLETRLERRLHHILIVEDDQVQLESLQHLLRSREVETSGATSAAECLDLLKTKTFDCMVLDLSLPDASGFSLLETLSREDRYSFPPAIVYTGRELSPDEEQKLRQYSKSIIIKGAKSPERLLDEVTLFLHQVISELPAEQQQLLEKAQSRETALEGKRVLVVEDDIRNIFALTSALEPKGLQLKIARDGLEALATLERTQASSADAVDLVLMDLMMPQMDGLTAIKEIRKRPAWSRLPIIALTAKAMPSDQQMCLDAGANDYISKPLNIDKLMSLIRVWMPR